MNARFDRPIVPRLLNVRLYTFLSSPKVGRRARTGSFSPPSPHPNDTSKAGPATFVPDSSTHSFRSVAIMDHQGGDFWIVADLVDGTRHGITA